ncbi:TIGR02281 family clan AA aspartic protease [Caldichromatium japonicum]|uniref:TIGR02281 family clan AA aspartic protease n=2 Tax=Caldichromatium japonicum TaxID=2699430 RepID=A0A6G7VGM0_9GAMM|nr:TIGR02281 family clan AA aspartic protease [Caldichromatium japonicum]
MRPDWPTRLGQALLFGAWVSGLAFLVWWFDQWLESVDNPNPNPNPLIYQTEGGGIEVVLKRNRAGHYVASGRINGEPVRFMIDTGATHVALPLDLARRLRLPLGPAETYQTANGPTRAWPTRLERLEIGSLVMQGVRASVLPNLTDEVLLGMSVLKSLELIQRSDTLILRRPPPASTR